ncbi:MAG: sigma-70 family RNA polymerase sigma factor [Actinobacteria bacterium]|nr:sigma-70 family RNA polymerase sigma factor [Actinomycetota bacterium]
MLSDVREDARPHEALILEHLDLVQHVVNQVAARYPRHVDRDELWNAGALGLVDAARRFDPDAGTPFPRYAAIRVRGAIIDSTRSRDWAPRTVRRRIRHANSAAEDFAVEHGRHPEPDELAAAMGVSTERLDRIRRNAVNASLLHLDRPVRAEEGEEATLADLLPEPSEDVLPEPHLEQRELIGTVRTAISCLPDVQREVIERYFFAGDYLRDIADDLGVTEARVSQIRSEALNAIRAYFQGEFEGVEPVDTVAPGRRSRAAFVAAVAARSTWRTRLEASDRDDEWAETA